MTNRKGLSQILYLIIAAAVMMMVALALFFSFSSGSDTSTARVQACHQSMRASCATAASGAEISIPSTCLRTVDGEQEVYPSVSASAVPNVDSLDKSGSDSTFTCTGE